MRLRPLLLTLCLCFPLFVGSVQAGTVTWVDSLAVTTVAVDCTFNARWASCTILPSGCSVLIKFGTVDADTVSWASKKWFQLLDGQPMSFIPYEPYFHNSLNRLEYKAVTGTGTIFISGIKTRYAN